jgi:hypothetical protein
MMPMENTHTKIVVGVALLVILHTAAALLVLGK